MLRANKQLDHEGVEIFYALSELILDDTYDSYSSEGSITNFVARSRLENTQQVRLETNTTGDMEAIIQCTPRLKSIRLATVHWDSDLTIDRAAPEEDLLKGNEEQYGLWDNEWKTAKPYPGVRTVGGLELRQYGMFEGVSCQVRAIDTSVFID